MSIWKVYKIQTGKTVKAGFDSEDEAREWLEINREGEEDNYLVEEMDHDEQDEFVAKNKKGAAEDETEPEEVEEEDDIEKGRYTYSTETDDGDDEDEEDGLIEEDMDDDGDGGDSDSDGDGNLF